MSTEFSMHRFHLHPFGLIDYQASKHIQIKSNQKRQNVCAHRKNMSTLSESKWTQWIADSMQIANLLHRQFHK